MAGQISYIVAFGGGIASFVSPCVLPLVPAYLSVIGGTRQETTVSSDTAIQGNSKNSLLSITFNTLLFILGFGAVFVAIGLTATSIGSALFRNRLLLTEVSGGVVLAMSLFLLLVSLNIKWPFLYREAKIHTSPSKFGFLAAPITGAAFGFGWTPCLGPVLASVTAVAVAERGVGQGAFLLISYSLGIGVPFLLLGLFYGKLTGAVKFFRRHGLLMMRTSALIMAAFGVLLLIDRVTLVTSFLESLMTHIGLGSLVYSG